MRLRIPPIAFAMLVALPRLAAAEDNVTKADALFHEGIKLRDSNLELACAKFGESLQLNPQAIGTLLNVALCDEKLGRIASALRRFEEARQRAIELRFAEHRKAAEEKIAALTPEVPHLAIKFAKPPPPQTKVVVDDHVVAASDLDDLRVDPGERTVIVSAPGRITFQKKVTIAKQQRLDVEVPALAKPVTSTRPMIGKIAVAGGGAMLATGVILGYVAHRRYEDQFTGDPRPCTTRDGAPPLCTNQGADAVGRARTLGNAGTVLGVVGVATIAVGGYLWFFAPKSGGAAAAERKLAVMPQLAPDGGGIAVFGRF
jgi:hypothetical protein